MTDFFASFSQIPYALFAFVLTISFLVAIHEYGHFWVARRFGVRIEKFSIGFGKPIIKWYGKRDNTEYSISWIPLGGYVKMYGESLTEPKAAEQTQLDLSQDNPAQMAMGKFSQLPPFKRLLIAFAGPAVNLLFAVLALWLLLVIGVPALKPTIGQIDTNSKLWHSSLKRGDTITAIDHHPIDSITDATIALVDALGKDKVLIQAQNTENTALQAKTVTIDLSDYQAGDEMAIDKRIGFSWAISEVAKKLPVVIGHISKNSAAQQAGIFVGDEILTVNGQVIKTWADFVQIVQKNPEKTLQLSIKRLGQKQQLTFTAARHPKKPELGYAGVSQQFDASLYAPYQTVKRYGVLDALPKSIAENYLQAQLMLKTLGRLARNKASLKNLGGPLSIADYSAKTLSAGYVTYLNFLASISLILAVMNLLPIPVLDGGHIMLAVIEMVKGKPLSAKTIDGLMRLGGSLLLTFMLFVISVDIWRYLF